MAMISSVQRRAAFAGKNTRAVSVRSRSTRAVQVSAIRGQYPDPEFCRAVLEAFPEQGIANVEEARVGCVWLGAGATFRA